jgi:hypothetical protein
VQHCFETEQERSGFCREYVNGHRSGRITEHRNRNRIRIRAGASASGEERTRGGIGKGEGRLAEKGGFTRVNPARLDQDVVFEHEEQERKDRDDSQRRMEVAQR